MPRIADIIRAPKHSVQVGSWKTGKVQSSAFPLKKKGMLPQGSAWQWRTVEFIALDREFVLLVRLNAEVEYYSSILAMRADASTQIICHHKFHQSHRSWHCHFIPDNVEDTFPGVLRDRDRMRVFDAEPSKSGKLTFDVQLADALNIASRRFRFEAADESPDQYSLL